MIRISTAAFDVALFDLDGVLTATAITHAACWKRMFDEFLARRAAEGGDHQPEFDLETDYRRYVDGRPRYDGVRAFLGSRGITLPDGAPTDPPTRLTICGLGNRKNALFGTLVQETPPTVYQDALTLIEQLHGAGLRTGVVSGSANAAAVLDGAGIAHLFEVRVDGRTAAEHGLDGKPAPDTFLEAARRMQVDPARAVVVEDAEAGIDAAVSGGFGLILGVAREGNAEALQARGASAVVTTLDEVEVARDLQGPAS